MRKANGTCIRLPLFFGGVTMSGCRALLGNVSQVTLRGLLGGDTGLKRTLWMSMAHFLFPHGMNLSR
jgi:hypothetical protein